MVPNHAVDVFLAVTTELTSELETGTHQGNKARVFLPRSVGQSRPLKDSRGGCHAGDLGIAGTSGGYLSPGTEVSPAEYSTWALLLTIRESSSGAISETSRSGFLS